MEIGTGRNPHGILVAFCCRRVLCAVANTPRCDDSTDAEGGRQRGVCPRSQRSVPRVHAVPSARRKVPRRLLVKHAATGSERHEKPNPVPSFFFSSGIVIDCAPPFASCGRLGRAGGTDDASCVCLKTRGKRRKDHSDETDLEYAVWLGVSAVHVWCAFRVAHLLSFLPRCNCLPTSLMRTRVCSMCRLQRHLVELFPPGCCSERRNVGVDGTARWPVFCS